MDARFSLKATFLITGYLRDGVTILLPNGSLMLAKRFEARVSPGRGFGGVPRLRIDRLITVHGAKLKADDTPGAVPGKIHYWLSEESTPVWVREIADAIESTECVVPAAPEPLTLTEPK